ncbi:ABC transporter ATP-binding protein [Sphaerobacter sp.]|uniref:ABC transporter ATP-binding protein n=1 Tax=Sphaerobacter sp. TaxID=2099654 RepID=UPI001D216FF2|nr:ABC transporter ATP-binding protein [Sphaerobacter sp.]MBX5443841.1 ABC transporter ATP-binding protein [Sphaerobacter sp.]
MASISLRSLTKRFGTTVAVNNLNLDLEEGELVALLGPSGCGKTTTLRMIAGFEEADSGTISFGGRDVTSLPPERRNTGMVFQNYALFPHLTVAQNVAFGLEMRKVPKAEIARRVDAILDKVQLRELADRYPRQLSGGQQQRTALARALVINPSVLLLDEPLANLDAKLREEMRFYIRSLQQEFGITTVYVTHDQSEALVLADRIAVMKDGVLQQVGTPTDIYQRPGNAWVADFIGLTNLVPGVITDREGSRVLVDTDLGVLSGTGSDGLRTGDQVLLSIRPESLRITSGTDTAHPGDTLDGAERNRLVGVVRERAYLGNLVDYRIEVGERVRLRVQTAPVPAYDVGDRVVLSFSDDQAWVVSDEGSVSRGDHRAEAALA